MLCLLRFMPGAALVLFLALFALVVRADPQIPVLVGVYDESVDPAHYWVSEKLDGVRAHWDGQTLSFRSGKPIQAPAWFTQGFPRQPLDGELWLGRGTFERLSGIVRTQQPVDAEWREVRYMLFELPDAPGTFTERQERLRQLAERAAIPWLQAVEQFRVTDRRALKAKLDAVVAGGGEGLMLHRADALYGSGASGDLLKLKPYLDADATVVGQLPGKGRHTGRMGALQVIAPDGRRFRIGTGFSDAQRQNPPPMGSVVIYRYRGLTAKGLPRFPVFLRMREAF